METRANYVLIGVFTLAVVVGVFGFVYWFQSINGTGERAFYKVQFEGTVSGLRTGASVLFNGIRVGEVTELKLDPQRPTLVTAGIAVDKNVAVRPDTEVGLEFQGLTGIAALSLKGGNPASPALVGAKDNPPLLKAPPSATQDVTQAVRDSLRKLQDFVDENRATFHSALKNLDTFSATLARNSDRVDSTLADLNKFTSVMAKNSERIDHIAEGLQNLTGGADGKGGDINEAARSFRTLAEHLDQRTAELTVGIAKLTSAGTRTLTTFDKAVKNFDANPTRVIWGGGAPATAPVDDPKKAQAKAK